MLVVCGRSCRDQAPCNAPRAGGAFELVSCPHYLAELVIYLGLLLLGPSCRLVLGLVLVWVVRGLTPATSPAASPAAS
jgi:hypothetical protein